jgi:hypothetical protein
MDERRHAGWAGLSVLGGTLVGIASFFAGILSVINDYDYVGAGLCFLASGFAFGLLANALFRR